MALRILLLLATLLSGRTAWTADTNAVGAPPDGELLLVPLAAAPFPHPSRAVGHVYQGQTYPTEAHYRDSTVAIFIPKGFGEIGVVDFVVHFHGWRNNVTNVLREYRLPEQFSASRRNAVLVVPQGPRDAPDSSGGRLEDAGGFQRFMLEVVETLRRSASLQRKDFQIGQIILSGHSGAYRVMAAIVDRGGLTAHVRELWLFDALYGETGRFTAWWQGSQGRWLNLYTAHGGTKDETEKLLADMQSRGTACLVKSDSAVTADELRTNRLVFLTTDLGHNDVLARRATFRTFLETSGLGRIP